MKHQNNKRLLTAAYQYSLVRLSLNFYTFYEIHCEDLDIPEPLKEYTVEFLDLLKDIINESGQEKQLVSLRNKVMKVMEVITAYTDCFQVYEYVINRMERRFDQEKVELVTDIKDFAEQVVNYITEAEEQNLIGFRVQSVLGQLPVRLTKQKFFEILTNSLSIYVGSEKQNFIDRLYFIRTESMLDIPDGMEVFYQELHQSLMVFQNQNYKELNEEQYDCLREKLEECSEILMHDSDLYLMLQELINDCYVIFLCLNDALVDLKEKDWINKMLLDLIDRFKREDWTGSDELIGQYLPLLEGRQESAFERYFRQSPDEHECRKDSLVWKVEQLLSDSPFIELDQDRQNEKASAHWIEQQINLLCSDLTGLFANQSKPVVRAIMAKVISGIPVTFKTVDELESYIRRSLEGCTDSGEREVSIQLLRQIMVDDYAMV